MTSLESKVLELNSRWRQLAGVIVMLAFGLLVLFVSKSPCTIHHAELLDQHDRLLELEQRVAVMGEVVQRVEQHMVIGTDIISSHREFHERTLRVLEAMASKPQHHCNSLCAPVPAIPCYTGNVSLSYDAATFSLTNGGSSPVTVKLEAKTEGTCAP